MLPKDSFINKPYDSGRERSSLNIPEIMDFFYYLAVSEQQPVTEIPALMARAYAGKIDVGDRQQFAEMIAEVAQGKYGLTQDEASECQENIHALLIQWAEAESKIATIRMELTQKLIEQFPTNMAQQLLELFKNLELNAVSRQIILKEVVNSSLGNAATVILNMMREETY